MLTKRTRIVLRCFVLGVILGILGFLAVYQPDSDAHGAAAQPGRPNIVVIMADDMRVDDLAAMPKTRRLLAGDNGTRYVNAYSSVPLCCPSRATFLTGQYAHNHGVWSNTAPYGWPAFKPLQGHALPTWLDPAYRTVMIGKYLNLYGPDSAQLPAIPPGWDHWAALWGPDTYNYHDFDVNVNGHVAHIRDGYQTRNLTGRAVTQIRQWGQRDPLFMFLSYVAPHEERNRRNEVFVPAEPKYKGTSTVGPPSSPAFNEDSIGDKPAWVAQQAKVNVADMVQARRERRDALRTVDDGVAQVVAELKRKHELSDTVLMFVSDNGYLLGEHRLTKKWYPYEESVSVPLLIRGPGFGAGVRRRPVVNVDLAKTIADLADVTVPDAAKPLDGLSLLEPQGGPRPVLLELMVPHDPLPAYSGLRTGRWMYADYRDNGNQPPDRARRELYNMTTDPWQTRNRIADQATRDDKQTLADQLDRLWNCAGAECR